LLLLCGCAKHPWVLYSSSSDGLEAKFPVTPRQESRSFPVGDKVCVVSSLIARKNDCEYQVSYFEYPRGIHYQEHEGIAAIARRLQAKVLQESVSSVATSQSLQPARAFRLALADGRVAEGKVAAAWENSRHPHRNYQMMVIRPAAVADKDTQTFLEGLKFLDE
jgi:hypothetical protein